MALEQIFFSIISILLVIVILLQQKSSSLGAMAGGDGGDDIAQTRRGADQFLHRATVTLGLLFSLGGIYFMLTSAAVVTTV